MFEKLENAPNKVVGLKQLLRGLLNDEVTTVYIADDADDDLKKRVMEAIGEKDIHIVSVESMLELGTACGIDVGADCAAILKN
ncbi:MAG: ribosomal L7Ae/L30e/S12e/Gadd45 family protein [Christensenella sp.]